jgi:hypothetical protein
MRCSSAGTYEFDHFFSTEQAQPADLMWPVMQRNYRSRFSTSKNVSEENHKLQICNRYFALVIFTSHQILSLFSS